MKWSSQPGANTGTNASSTVAPERSIAALKVSSWRLIASGPFDLSGPRATTRSVIGGMGVSDQKQRTSPAAIAIKIRKFVALAGRVPGRRRLVRRHRARLDTGEVGDVMGKIARRPEFAVADAVDAGLDLFLDRLGDGRRDLGGDHHRVGDFGAR